MPEMIRLINFDFYDKELSDVRGIFVYQSFAGPSYAELHALKQCQLVSGIDGKTWMRKKSLFFDDYLQTSRHPRATSVHPEYSALNH